MVRTIHKNCHGFYSHIKPIFIAPREQRSPYQGFTNIRNGLLGKSMLTLVDNELGMIPPSSKR